MKVALVKVPDAAAESGLTAVQYPVNVGYLASVSLAAGHEVEVWDFCVEPSDDASLRARLRAFRPDVLGLSCVTPAILNGARIAALAKREIPGILTVVGGVHVAALPAETLAEFDAFDLGATMEAEEILPEILAAFAASGAPPRGIAGTVYRGADGRPVVAPKRPFPDPNRIPYPNRDLVPAERYARKHSIRGFSRQFWRIVEVDSARGCPFSCTFCGVALTHGHKVRYRTPENVLGEIGECVRRYRTDFVVFNDSTFTLDRRRVLEIVEALPSLGIRGYLVNGHTNCVDAEMLAALARTGCRKIVYGIESGSDAVLKKIRKGSTVERAVEAFRLSREAGIPMVEATFILGADVRETEDDFRATEALIRRLSPDILGLGIITPFPGTEQYTELKRLGYLEGIPWDRFQIFADTPPPWRIVNFSAEALVERRNRILKSYYWNAGYVLRRLRGIRSPAELLYYARLARSFFRVVVRPRA